MVGARRRRVHCCKSRSDQVAKEAEGWIAQTPDYRDELRVEWCSKHWWMPGALGKGDLHAHLEGLGGQAARAHRQPSFRQGEIDAKCCCEISAVLLPCRSTCFLITIP